MAQGGFDAVATGSNSYAGGNNVQALGITAHAEGTNTQAGGVASHAEGISTIASLSAGHAEGIGTQATGIASHAEGDSTTASNRGSHSEGVSSTSSGFASHAEGGGTQAIGLYSHAEGESTTATGSYSHAEGQAAQAIGIASHAEGNYTQAIGDYSHAEGNSTIASGSYQHVSGQYNTHGDATSLFIIGNGVDDNNRSDIVRVTTTDVQVTGSLNVSGSQIHFYPVGDFTIYDPTTNVILLSIDLNGIQLNDKATGNISVEWADPLTYVCRKIINDLFVDTGYTGTIGITNDSEWATQNTRKYAIVAATEKTVSMATLFKQL